MRFVFALMIMAVLLTGPVMAQDLTSDKGKLSYAVGWDIGQDIQRRGAEFDVDTIVAAIRDAAAGRDPQVASEEMVALLTELQQKVRQEQAAAFQKLAEENQAMSEEFLNSNLSKNGIVELPSGVQYRIIDEGEKVIFDLKPIAMPHSAVMRLQKLIAPATMFLRTERSARRAAGNPATI